MSRTGIASRAVPNRESQYLGSPKHRIISPASPEFGTCGVIDMSRASWASGLWHLANDPLAIPFCLPEPGIVVDLGWVNGSSSGGNVDIGIYDTSWNRLVSAGSTAAGSSNAWGWANVTDTPLGSGRYWLVMVRDNVTANRLTRYGFTIASPVEISGCFTSTTDAFPLPNPLTNMVAATGVAFIPGCAMAITRAHA